MEYQWIKSDRKTIAIQIDAFGNILVRTPKRVSRSYVEELLEQKREWIFKQQKRIKERAETDNFQPDITDEERRQGIEKARKIFPARVKYFAEIMDVTYGRITIREQKTRWGSCSGKGNLNFNWKLVRMPEEILDYVVVHELAHRKEMNHSKAFWEIVESVLPDYRKRRKWLRENGR